LTSLATLLASVPEDFRLEAFVTSKDLQEKYEEYPFTVGNHESGRKKGTHPLDQGCEESREEIDPCKLAI
jgi:hypothetical protein